MTRLLSGAAGRPVSPDGRAADGQRTHHHRNAGGLRSPQQRSRVFWNTEPLLRNGERKVSDEFSLRPTRDPSARRRKLTPDAKRPSGHPRLRRPKALCVSPIVRHGFANQHEAQTGTVPVGDIRPLRLKPQTDADGLRSRSPSVPAAKPDGYCGVLYTLGRVTREFLMTGVLSPKRSTAAIKSNPFPPPGTRQTVHHPSTCQRSRTSRPDGRGHRHPEATLGRRENPHLSPDRWFYGQSLFNTTIYTMQKQKHQ